MDLLETKIRVNKQAYSSITYSDMSDSLEDAYNDFLSQFTARKVDPRYNDAAHQYLQSKDGNTYYFDSFKYIFPSDDSKDLMQALNSNVGRNKVNIVEYTGNAILTRQYDFNNSSVQATSYFITDETRNYIDTAYGKPISMGDFLLQISGNNIGAIESMQKGASIKVSNENGMLVARDSEGNVIEENMISSKDSFYKTVQNAGNLDALLNAEYSKGHTGYTR